MFKISLLIGIIACICFVNGVYAQDSGQRTRDLIAALDKTKYKKKEKANVSVEVFVDIKNEPAGRSDLSEYSGTYESDGYRLTLAVDKGGAASGTGFDSFMDSGKTVNFTLKDAKVEGALLIATKVYENGDALSFEAVFVNRKSRAGSNPNTVNIDVTQFGLGFIQTEKQIKECDQDKAIKSPEKNASVAEMANRNSGWTNRVFLERK
jgi:hypothetical protein